MMTKQLAEQIVNQTMVRLHRNINVMDLNGMILASGELERIERIHEGAAHVAKTGKPLYISSENIREWPGSKPGINMPIFFQDELFGVIGITGDPDEMKEFATLIQLTTEMMVHQAMTASEAEWKRKMHELLFAELISSKPLHGVSKERITRTEYLQNSPYIVVMIECNGKQSPQRWISQLETQFKDDFVLIGHEGLNEIFILTSSMDMPRLTKKLSAVMKNQSGMRAGIGNEVIERSDIRISYDSAKIALSYGSREQIMIHYEEIELISLLKRLDSNDASTFSKRILNGLDPKLRETVAAYLSHNQRHAECAESLGIHRHTLTYRLEKIKDQTGYDPTIFMDALKIQLALLLREDAR